tara:strand:+ start:1527 stop:2063 length:537 start_codon:yes stop_codon:yes gene_type:complete
MEKEVLYEVAYFIMNNPGKLIRFLNSQGYDVPMSATTQELNDIVADGLFNPQFLESLIKFIAVNDEHINFIVAIATAVSAIASAISGMVINAKMALFSRQQALKAGEYNKEVVQWQKDQAVLAAKKGMSIELSRMQSEMILDRDIQEEKQKSKRNITMFGMFAVGAIVLTVVAKKLTD